MDMIGELDAEIVELDRRIKELQQERAALSRARQRRALYSSVSKRATRKNSFNREMIEGRILAELGNFGRPMRSSELLERISGLHIDMKPATFRSNLTRMKQKGLVTNDGNKPAKWSIPA